MLPVAFLGHLITSFVPARYIGGERDIPSYYLLASEQCKHDWQVRMNLNQMQKRWVMASVMNFLQFNFYITSNTPEFGSRIMDEMKLQQIRRKLFPDTQICSSMSFFFSLSDFIKKKKKIREDKTADQCCFKSLQGTRACWIHSFSKVVCCLIAEALSGFDTSFRE